jgi:hypothetical protein
MTISRRLILTLSIALVALTFVGSLGLWRLKQAQRHFEYFQVNLIPSVTELEKAKSAIDNYSLLNVGQFSSTDDAGLAAANAEIDAGQQTYRSIPADCISDDTDGQSLVALEVSLVAYRVALQSFHEKVRSGEQDGAVGMPIARPLRDAGPTSYGRRRWSYRV